MSYVVTGATGHLGRLVVEELLERDVPAGQIVAAGRKTEKIKDFADQGVQTQPIDFDEPASLREAFNGASRVLLVSVSEVGRRAEQHANAIDAARAAGVELLVYTSVANADSTKMELAKEHQDTEEVLRSSGVPFALLRNGWYLENYTEQLPTYLEQTAIVGSAGEGRVSAATRADYAAAAATVLLADGQVGSVYELGGDEAFTLGELATEVATQSAQNVQYRDLPVEEYAQLLVGVGLPKVMADIVADSDVGISRGDLYVESGDLARLIGRKPTTMPAAVASALS